jgi:protoporphyrinogen oxidase
MPMPDLGAVCPGVGREEKACLRRLKWNSLLIFSLGLSGKPSPAEHWIYFPGKEFVFYRVCFPHNFSSASAPAGRGSLYAEVSYPPGRRPGTKQLRREVLSGLRRAGIVSAKTSVCAEDVLEIKYAYPVYDRKYASSRRSIISSFLSRGVVLCGRYGSWRYFSMEDAMLDGISAAERTVGDA